MPRRVALGGLALGVVALVLLRLWQGDDYWDYPEGVYLLSARLWNHGSELYRHMVGAQPPGVFLAGAGILRVHDSLGFIRLVLGVGQLGAGLIAARVAWRLSASPVAAVLTPALVLLTPWAIHEHGSLTPEVLAPPLLLGGALLAARPRTAAAGGRGGRARGLAQVPLRAPARRHRRVLERPPPDRARRRGHGRAHGARGRARVRLRAVEGHALGPGQRRATGPARDARDLGPGGLEPHGPRDPGRGAVRPRPRRDPRPAARAGVGRPLRRARGDGADEPEGRAPA